MEKGKKIGLVRKKYLKETMLLIFILKLYQFIRIGEKDEFIKELDSLYKEKSLFKEFIKYFKKIG